MERTKFVSCCRFFVASSCGIGRRISQVMLALTALGLMMILTACDSGLRQTSSFNYLALEFSSDRSQAHVGEPIHVRFAIKNTGLESTVVESKNTPVMDIRVEEAGSQVLLTWSAQNPAQVSHRLEWKPGEVKVIEWTWIPRQEDVYIGSPHDIGLIGILSGGQAAGVRICASNVCY